MHTKFVLGGAAHSDEIPVKAGQIYLRLVHDGVGRYDQVRDEIERPTLREDLLFHLVRTPKKCCHKRLIRLLIFPGAIGHVAIAL
jgi:hypothetical protein